MDVALNELGDGQFCMGEYHYSPGRLRRGRGRCRTPRGAGHRRRRRSLQPADVPGGPGGRCRPGSRRCPATGSGGPGCQAQLTRLRGAVQRPQLRPRQAGDGNPGARRWPCCARPRGQPFYLNLHSSPEARLGRQEAAGQHTDHRLDRRRQDDAGDVPADAHAQVGPGAAPGALRPGPRLRDRDPRPRGRYFTLEAGKPTGCNPLQREPTPARIQFWEQLIRTCIATPAMPLLPADERAIADAVKAVAMMPAPLRRFSTVRQNLPKAGENNLFERLGRWCQGGALGWVFDRPTTACSTCTRPTSSASTPPSSSTCPRSARR